MDKRNLYFPKKLLSILFVLLLSVAGMMKGHAQSFAVGNLNYSVNSDGTSVTVTGHVNGTSATGGVTIPSNVSNSGISYSVTSIGEDAFYGCSGLTSVTIPNSVATIGDHAFYRCSGISSISLPDAVTTIAKYTFSECTNLSSVTFGNAVTLIGKHSFSYCSSLTEIVIPNTVTRIVTSAFYKCNNLSSVILSNSIGTIETSVFCDCSSLSSIELPSSVHSIETSAFLRSGLTSINTNAVFTIGQYAFSECNNLVSVTLGNSLSTIENYAFSSCGNLSSVSFGGAVSSIGQYAFRFCSQLTSISIPNSVTTIGRYAFADCTNLVSVTIGNSVSSIGDYGFNNCTGLTSMTVLCSTPPIVGSWTFVNIDSNILVYIPCSTLEAYQSAQYWSRFNNYFEINCPYSISASINPTEAGTVTGVGDYEDGQTCTLTAVANEGYTFVNWTENGEVVSTDAEYTFTVTGERTLVANFILNSYDITVTASPTWGGNVAVANQVTNSWTGETINHGYGIIEWNGTPSENVNILTIRWKPDRYWQTYILSFNAETGLFGIVFEDAYYFSPGQDVDEYVYDDEDGIYEAEFEVLWYSDNVAHVLFRPEDDDDEWEIKVFGGGNYGSCEATGIAYIEGGVFQYNYGETCTLAATPNEGYIFVNWTENGEEVSTDASYSFTVTSNRNLVANFTETSNTNHWTAITGTQYNLTMSGIIYIDGVAQTSTSLEIGAFCGDECRGSARAQFFPPTGEYVVSLAVVSNQQSGETITFRLYDHDTQQEFPSECINSITFVANTNFGEMYNWYQYAFFNTVTITATVTPEGAGTVEGAGDYMPGSACTLTANANEGYTFVNWTIDGEVVSTDNPYTFTVNSAAELTANFSLNSYSITASSNPTTGGTIDGTGTYYHFSSCTLTATANTGYVFQSWSVADEVVSTDNPYTFTVNSTAELTANFSLISYDITATSNPTTGGIIDGTGTYDHFSSCTLTATANTGYAFRSWSVNGETVSTDNPYTLTVSGAVELTANFDAQETTTLDNGWTWWSTSIEMSGIDGLSMLEESLGHNGLTIKSANKFVQNYYPNTGYDYWFGQLTSDDFNNESSYMIQTSTSCEVTMTGMYANPSDHPIQLYPNWTWIGYPCGIQQSAASAFADFTPTHNDLLKGQYAFSTYYDNYGWFPEFSLTPGQGYMYQSLASDNRTLTFANGSKADPVPTNREDRYWRNNVHAYADNMNVIAVVTISGEEQHGEDIELGAFVNGECRGSAMLKHFQPTDRWYAMLTVTGADGDEIEFGVIDRNRGMTSDRSLVFQTNTIVGELDEPYVIDFGTLGCIENGIEEPMHIYPNPIERNTRFTIALPETETLSDIFVVNMMGEVVAYETNKDKMTALQTPGVYTVKVVCRSGKVFLGKLVVR